MNRMMKDSGVEWIGEIPTDWSISNIGQLYSERKEKVDDINYSPLSVTMKGILPQLETAAKSDDHENRKHVCKNDFVINSRSDRRGSCGISELEGSVSLINTVLIPHKNMSNSFYNWLFKSSMFSDEFYKWGHGIVDDLWTTRWQDMKKIQIPLPPLTEQQKIAAFLDEKCGAIDEIISKTEQSIEGYKKLKQSVITKAVTKGIRPNRPMQDSNIEWIGEFPTDWNVRKIKDISNLFGRIGFRGYTTNDLVSKGEGAITLSPSNISDDFSVHFDKCSYLSWFKYDESPEIQVNVGDIIFVKTGSSYGKSGLVSVLPECATINPQLIIFKNCKINNRLFLYILQSSYVQYQCQITVVGGTIPTMSQEKIKNFSIILPHSTEQKEIADYLDEKCSDIDILIEKKQQFLAEMANYKKSLIYEYVTGKKEVA